MGILINIMEGIRYLLGVGLVICIYFFISPLSAFSSLSQDRICICRRVRGVEEGKGKNQVFISYGQELKFDGEERILSREEADIINQEMKEFVLGITGASRILNISEPIPHLGTAAEMGGRVRTYEFIVETDKGEISVFLKWIEEPVEAERFLKASELGIAPPSREIPLGYVVSEGIKGTKLEILRQDTKWLSSPSNYTQLAQQLGEVVAKLESIGYSERLEHNVIVEFREEEIKIWVVDYEDARISIGLIESEFFDNAGEEIPGVEYGFSGFIRDINPLHQQVQEWISGLSVEGNIRQKMLEIFTHSYNEAGGSYH